MKKRYLILIQVALSLLLISSVGFAAPNIDGYFKTGEWTIDSGTPYSSVTIGGDRNTPRHENANKKFKAKKNQFFVNGKKLIGPGGGGDSFNAKYLGLFIDDQYLYFGLKTGFNLKDGVKDCYGRHYDAGDIAIDFSQDLDTGPDFEFGIDLDDNIDLSDETRGPTSLWEVNKWSSPWLYKKSTPFQIDKNNNVNDGVWLANATKKKDWKAMSSTGKNNVDYFARFSGHGKKSDVFEGKIKLSLLQKRLTSINLNLNGDSSYYATIHWTMSCGNDYLNKTIQYSPYQNSNSPVPEPATILLFGMGLFGAGVLGRKKMVKNNKKNINRPI